MSSVARFEGSLRQWATSQAAVRRLWVFGSVVKGAADPSDLDIAVEIDASDPTLFWIDHGTQWQCELQALFPIKVDLVLFEPTGGSPTVAKGLSEAKWLAYERAS